MSLPADVVPPADRGPIEHTGLELIDDEECFRLLGAARLGRVAVSVDALPAVFPVHFALLGRDPVFRTEAGAKLTAASAGNVICLEADDVDAESHTGWSVMVTGPAEVLRPGPDLDAALRLPLRPWVGSGDAFVRIGAALVSGRRVVGPVGGTPAPSPG